MKKNIKKFIFPTLAIIFALSISPNFALADMNWGYENPLKVNSVTEWLKNLLASIQGLVGWLAVLMIFFGGIVYITSAGVSRQTELAKNIIKWALIGFAIAVAGPALLKEIVALVSSNQTAGSDLIDSANTFQKITINILSFLLSGVGILALIGFVIGGATYLLSAGNKSQVDAGKKMILYSIIAIAISGSGVILLRQIMLLLEARQ